MICKFCGNELADDAVFCGRCGQRVAEEAVAPVATAAEPVYETPENQKKRKKHASSILVLSIFSLIFVAVALSFTGKSFLLWLVEGVSRSEAEDMLVLLSLLLPIGVVAIILSFLAGKKVKNHRKTFGEIRGAAKAGQVISVLTRIASIVNIVLHVFLVFLFIYISILKGHI